jgi:acetyl esterase/lipase
MATPSLDDPIKNTYDIRREIVVSLNKAFLMPGGIDPQDPRHSPVYRNLKGLPPMLVQVAGHDVCHDDSIRLAASARASKGRIHFDRD